MNAITATICTPLGNWVKFTVVDTGTYKLTVDRKLKELVVPSAQISFIMDEIRHYENEQVRYEKIGQKMAVSQFCDRVLMLKTLLNSMRCE
jgi:hypothetical protein